MNKIIEQLAQKEYELFVVNTTAVAVQGRDGNYYTEYIPVTPFLLQNMLSQKGSLGCYQQKYRTNRIRWICFDFDCNEKENPDIQELYSICITPLIDFLTKNDIHYLQEFSGRRGIHIWILFEEMITKELGYDIVNTILNQIPELKDGVDNEKWGLDRFPAARASSTNIVGKQVKFPLSWHQNGSRSYLFEGGFETRYDIESEEFYCDQYLIMQKVRLENAEELCHKLHMDEPRQNQKLYVQYEVSEGFCMSPEQVISYLSEILVFRRIFERMRRGQQQEQDWFVLLGTLGRLDSDGEILLTILNRYPGYDESTTRENIRKHRKDYYPATFDYLYQIYNLEMEDTLEQEETGYEYLLRRAGMEKPKRIETEKSHIGDWRDSYSDLKKIIRKEKRYVVDNDEVIPVEIMNGLMRVSNYELYQYNNFLQKLRAGEMPFDEWKPMGYKTYLRKEEDKTRILVSLGKSDRIITTAVMLDMCREWKHGWKSYSYQISYMSDNYLFHSWFSSWSRYIREIKCYLEIPFMDQNYVSYIDLKQCYDHVDLLNVYRQLEGKLNEKAKRYFEYLAYYNDELMKEIQGGSRVGVPQGPAYARVLAELYLDNIVEKVCTDMEKGEYRILRYVDDIVVFSRDEETAYKLYQALIAGFARASLPLNRNKTRFPQKIADIDHDYRNSLLHRSQFNYELVQNEYSGLLLEYERNDRINHFLETDTFQMDTLSYIYSCHSFEEAQYRCFYRFGGQIMESGIGRGRGFRKFYEFVLEREELVWQALQNQWFQNIPVDTVNFSNLIATMYYLIDEGRLSDRVVEVLLVYYLNEDFEFGALSEEDRIVVEAIMMKYGR